MNISKIQLQSLVSACLLATSSLALVACGSSNNDNNSSNNSTSNTNDTAEDNSSDNAPTNGNSSDNDNSSSDNNTSNNGNTSEDDNSDNSSTNGSSSDSDNSSSDNNTSNSGNTSEDNNSDNSSTNGSIKFSSIDVEYSDSTKNNYVTRTDYELYNGRTVTKHSVIKSQKDVPDENVTEIYLAPNFEQTFTYKGYDLPQPVSKTLKILSKNMFVYHYKSLSNNNKISVSMSLGAQDISGVNSSDPEYHTEFKDLNLMNFTFPKGSVCYYFDHETSNIDYLFFESTNLEVETDSIDKWLKKAQSRAGDRFVAIHRIKVGENNQYDAAYIETTTDSKESGEYPAIVNYKGKLCRTGYTLSTGYHPDVSKGKAPCDHYNKIAANFLEESIKTAWKP